MVSVMLQVPRSEMQAALALRFGGDGIVKMKGLPFKATADDVIKCVLYNGTRCCLWAQQCCRHFVACTAACTYHVAFHVLTASMGVLANL